MTNQIDKRTSFKYLCECGSKIVPVKDMDEAVYVARSYDSCAIYRLKTFPIPDAYEYVCDLFVDKSLRGGEPDGISSET